METTVGALECAHTDGASLRSIAWSMLLGRQGCPTRASNFSGKAAASRKCFYSPSSSTSAEVQVSITMGSARVQYELERTLPSLQLAAEHALFDRETEIRAITQKRRHFEGTLVRRHVLVSDFLRYVEYEESLEKLRVIRLERTRQIQDVPRKDIAKMHNEAIHHIVSIFERGTKRCRDSIDLWRYYLEWSQKMKMRSATSRISARALALFPNNTNLWLFVADHELNHNLNPGTARALLLRAIRLNVIAHQDLIEAQKREAASRPKKKRKVGNKFESFKVVVRPAGRQEDDEPFLVASSLEQDLIRLWIEYVRMELVFLERLRRRKAVLNITDEELPNEENEDAAQDGEMVPENGDGEGVPTSIEEIAKETREEVADGESAQESILLGAIPATAIVSATSLDSTSSLPPRTHFGFLMAVAHLIRTFPFLGDSKALQHKLNQAVSDALKARFSHDASIVLYECTTPILDRAFLFNLALDSEESEREKDKHVALQRASRLAAPYSKEIMRAYGESGTDDLIPRDVSSALGSILSQMQDALGQIYPASEAAVLIHDVIRTARQRVIALPAPNSTHIAMQLQTIQAMKYVALNKDLGDEFQTFLQACIKRVTKDASRLRCKGIDVDMATFMVKLEDARTTSAKEQSAKILEEIRHDALHLIQSERDARLPEIIIEALQMSSDRKQISLKETETVWTTLLGSSTAKADINTWRCWIEWVVNNDELDDKMRKNKLLAFLPRTASQPEIHEMLLKSIYSVEISVGQIEVRRSTALWIKRHAFPLPTFWRWAIKSERRLLKLSEIHHDKDLFVGLIKLLYTLLLEPEANPIFVDDILAFLHFLCFEAHAIETAMDVLRESLTRFSNHPDARVQLSKGWKEINKELRHDNGNDEDESSEDRSDEESSERADSGMQTEL